MSSKGSELGSKDIVFPIMGLTGAGKSTFINVAVGRDVTEVGHSTTGPCTTELLSIIIDPIPNCPKLRGYRLVLLDTPGFNATYQQDVETFNRIAKWLEASHRNGALVGGALYFQDMSDKYFTNTASQNLLGFSRLCRGQAVSKTVLVTTNWPSDRDNVLERREEEMKRKHWKPLIEKGLEVRRFQRNWTSAWDVINLLLHDIKLPYEPGPKDIVLLIMGPTGVGKSTFINLALDKDVTEVGHGPTSCTKQPLPIIIDPIPDCPELRGYRLILLDTPGFDDTHEEDEKILDRIAKWLEASRRKGALLGGILYLHDISVKPFTRTAHENLLMFSRLCGHDATPKTVLVTTNWPSHRDEVLEQRQKEMKDKHWKRLVEKGLDIRRFQQNRSSAWEIINLLLQRNNADNGLDLQIRPGLRTPTPMVPPSSSRAQVNISNGKDIIIPVLGPTGSGKSTFINNVIGTNQMEVSDHTTSCTTEPSPAYVISIPKFPNLKGYRLVLLDTPGFDDTFVDDVEILKRIADWLAESRRQGALVGGVLYLHDISTKRLTSTARKNLDMLIHLCGEDSMKKTVLVTTNWDLGASNELYIEREGEMKTKYWGPIIQKGGKVHRFLRNRESAWDIINMLLQCADLQDPLLLQKQLVDFQIPFSETEAGRHAVSVAEKKKDTREELTRIMDQLGSIVPDLFRGV